jgi:hypothetical protein
MVVPWNAAVEFIEIFMLPLEKCTTAYSAAARALTGRRGPAQEKK